MQQVFIMESSDTPMIELWRLSICVLHYTLLSYMPKPATLLKVALLHGCFSHFLCCVNGTKSCKASHILKFLFKIKNKKDLNFI